MKNLILIIILVCTTSCAHIKKQHERLTSRDGLTAEERQKRQDAANEEEMEEFVEEQRNEERRTKVRALHDARTKIKPGASINDVKILWGEPDRIDFKNGHYLYWYDDIKQPRYFVFSKNEKLIEWFADQDTIDMRDRNTKLAEREYQQNQISERNNQKLNDLMLQNAQMAEQQSWNNLSNTLNQINTQNKLDQMKTQQDNMQYQQQRQINNSR